MTPVLNPTKNVNEKIALVKQFAFKNEEKPNLLQTRLELIYGISKPEIINRYSTYKKEWGKFIDIED